MNTSPKGIALIKEFEGWRSKAYRDPVGVLTIGYGHTSRAGPPEVTSGMTITRAEGTMILRRDLQKYENYVERYVKVDLNQNQFDALVSFCYNVGPGNFRKSSVLKAVNQKNFKRAAQRFHLWNKAGGRTLPGLVRRRAAESALFGEHPEFARLDVDEVGIEPEHGKSRVRSKTMWVGGSQALGAAAMATTYASEIKANVELMLEGYEFNHIWVIGGLFLLFTLLAGAWVMYDRNNKIVEDGV